MRWSFLKTLLLMLALALLPDASRAEQADSLFDSANQLYEQGKFTEAAPIYYANNE